MLRAVQPGTTFNYVPKECRDLPEDSPDRVSFDLKYLDVDELAKVEDSIGAYDREDDTMKVKVGTQMLVALRMGLRGWTNFKFGDGSDAPFDTKNVSVKRTSGRVNENVPTDATLGLIPSPIRTEIANAITEGNKLTEEVRGNSE